MKYVRGRIVYLAADIRKILRTLSLFRENMRRYSTTCSTRSAHLRLSPPRGSGSVYSRATASFISANIRTASFPKNRRKKPARCCLKRNHFLTVSETFFLRERTTPERLCSNTCPQTLFPDFSLLHCRFLNTASPCAPCSLTTQEDSPDISMTTMFSSSAMNS